MDDQNNNLPSNDLNSPQQIYQTYSPTNDNRKNPSSRNENLPMEFNYYPMPNRKDSMSNRCLDETDFPKRKFKQLCTKRDFSLNNYSLDIEGASPRSNSIFTNKID